MIGESVGLTLKVAFKMFCTVYVITLTSPDSRRSHTVVVVRRTVVWRRWPPPTACRCRCRWRKAVPVVAGRCCHGPCPSAYLPWQLDLTMHRRPLELTTSTSTAGTAPSENSTSIPGRWLAVHSSSERNDRVPTGHGKLEKVREFEWLGKVRGKYFLEKLGKKLVPPGVRFSD